MSEPAQDPKLDVPQTPPTAEPVVPADEAVPSEASELVSIEASPEFATNDGLPEWEPLTPEIVEDEAIRGDFMLRWAVVLLALMIGCRQIVEPTTLVHVKTGQYLAAHGFWPPANDVFSATASEHRWVNLSWLWDLIASGSFALGEGMGLSLLTAMLVALTWWLLGKTSRSNVSSWWGSVLGAMTLIACHQQFSGQPETVTLLGMAALLWWLQKWRQSLGEPDPAAVTPATNRTVSLWWLVPAFALWSNLDSRMFLGLFALLFWGVGETLGSRIGRGVLSAAQRKLYWTVFAACVAASLLNPFGWQALLSPVVLYGTEYPALRGYVNALPRGEELGPFPLWAPIVWLIWTLPLLCGGGVLGAAAVTLILNFGKASFGDVLLFVGMTVLACVASNELAVASVVACVIGTLHAQQWYQSKFRQTYSIATSELLFTRGGRAVTVCGFFVLAVLAVNQWLFGVDGKRIGLGLSTPLRSMIDGYRKAVADSLDSRPFNLTPRQGDVLIWVDQQPFVDSRMSVFAGPGDEDLLALHDRTRRSLAPPTRQASEADPSATSSGDSQLAKPSADDLAEARFWKQTFERFQLTHVIPRLVGVRPVTYFKLLTSPDWQLTHLGSMCAVLYRQDAESAELKKYLADHRVDFKKPVFEADSPLSATRNDWPRARTAFQRYLSPSEKRTPNSVQEAENLLLHLNASASGQISIDHSSMVAMSLLAIRKAQEGLAEVPNQALAFEVLGDAYTFLSQLEINVLREMGINTPNELRFNQGLAAYYQAMLLDPDQIGLRFRFITLLQQFNRLDLALREMTELERLADDQAAEGPDVEEMLRRIIPLKEQWTSRQDALREQLDKAIEAGARPIDLAPQVYQGGFTLEALKLLDRDLVAVRESPEAQTLRGLLLFESGQLETAYSQFEYESANNVTSWRTPAAWCRLAHGEYDQAIDLWKQQVEFEQQVAMNGLVISLPLVQSPLHLRGYANIWPVQHSFSAVEALYRRNDEQTQLLWNIAMMQLESGKPRLAAKTLSGILEATPDTFRRPLIRFYLFVLTQELIDVEPPSDWIPIDKDMFAPEVEPVGKES